MLDYSKRKCYGFVKNKNEEFIINESEAQNVKLIFECFLNGMSLGEIANELYSKGISSPSGKDTWSRKVISSVLSNEKYYLYGIISKDTFEKAEQSKVLRTSQAIKEEKVVELENATEIKVEETKESTVKLTQTNVENSSSICYYVYNNIDIKSAVISTLSDSKHLFGLQVISSA